LERRTAIRQLAQVGIVWRGSACIVATAGGRFAGNFASLAAIEGVQLYSLQVVPRATHYEAFQRRSGD